MSAIRAVASIGCSTPGSESCRSSWLPWSADHPSVVRSIRPWWPNQEQGFRPMCLADGLREARRPAGMAFLSRRPSGPAPFKQLSGPPSPDPRHAAISRSVGFARCRCCGQRDWSTTIRSPGSDRAVANKRLVLFGPADSSFRKLGWVSHPRVDKLAFLPARLTASWMGSMVTSCPNLNRFCRIRCCFCVDWTEYTVALMDIPGSYSPGRRRRRRGSLPRSRRRS